jgi:hypothetical protein
VPELREEVDWFAVAVDVLYKERGTVPELREEVSWFASQMEKHLRRNNDKGGWLECDQGYLLTRLHEEMNELEFALEEGHPGIIIHEAADVANFAMMLADRVRPTKKGKPGA